MLHDSSNISLPAVECSHNLEKTMQNVYISELHSWKFASSAGMSAFLWFKISAVQQ